MTCIIAKDGIVNIITIGNGIENSIANGIANGAANA
jgi:hypothetical protein